MKNITISKTTHTKISNRYIYIIIRNFRDHDAIKTVTNRFKVFEECKVELVAVERPRAELERARLEIERKVCDVDRTRTEEDRLWDPQDRSIVGENGHCLAMLLQPSIGTAYNFESISNIDVALAYLVCPMVNAKSVWKLVTFDLDLSL